MKIGLDVDDVMQRCVTCKEFKNTNLFGSRYYRGNKQGLQSVCKECMLKSTSRSYHKNIEINRQKRRDWYAKNKVSAKERAYWFNLNKTYGVTKEIMAHMLEEQNGKCAICLVPFSRKPNVDHCHSSGKVRGLLCKLCNSGLGSFKDNPENLGRAILYLVKQ